MSFEQQVNEAVDGMVEGKLADDLSPEVKYAAGLEKRRRDTQAEFSKGQHKLGIVEAENKKLTEGWAKDISLSTEQVAELEALKSTDPDAWKAKVDEYEGAAQTKFTETREAIATEAKTETEAESRDRLIKEFDEANPDIDLSDDVIQNDLPPRYLKKLESGELTFAEFLDQAKEYLTKGKVLKQEDEPDDISLSKAAGGSVPEDRAVEEDARKSYENETY